MRAAAFGGAGKLDLAGENRRITPFAENAKVGTRVCTAAVLFNFGVRERPVCAACKQRICPGFDIAAERELVLADFV